MTARREAADRNLCRVNAERLRIAADMQHSPGSVNQRLPVQGRLFLRNAAGVVQHEHIVPRLQKLHGHRVSLPRTAIGVAAAGQNQHGRARVEGGHFGGFVPQIADELCPAGERVGIHFHFQFLFSDGFRFVMGWAAIYSASMSAAIRQSSGQGRFL